MASGTGNTEVSATASPDMPARRRRRASTSSDRAITSPFPGVFELLFDILRPASDNRQRSEGGPLRADSRGTARTAVAHRNTYIRTMQSRLYPFATIIAAVTSIALTALPWVRLDPLGIPASWNGLGMADTDVGMDMGVVGVGWAVVAACVVAVLAALISLMPSPKVRPLVPLANAVAAAACALSALAPIITLIWPSAYYGDLFTNLGASDLTSEVPLNTAVIVSTTVAVLVTALVCAIATVAALPDREARVASATKP